MDKNCCGSCAVKSTMKMMKASNGTKGSMSKPMMPKFSSGGRKMTFAGMIPKPKVKY